MYVHKNLTPIVGWSIKMKAQIQSLIEKYLKDEGVCASWSAQNNDFFHCSLNIYLLSEKNFVHFKVQVLFHLSKIFYEILYLSPPIDAQPHYSSPIFMYNVALKFF